MTRHIVLGGLAATLLGCLAAQAQQTVPELEGGPGSHVTKPEAAHPRAIAKPAPQEKTRPPVQTQTQAQAQAQAQAQVKALADAETLKSERANLAEQAKTQKAEQVRLAQRAEELRLQEARLEAKSAALAAEEAHLAEARADQASERARLAEPERPRQETATAEDLPAPRGGRTAGHSVRALEQKDRTPSDERAADAEGDRETAEPLSPRIVEAELDVDAARRSCARAGEDGAQERHYYSARYDSAPRFYRSQGWELRGTMRLEDRRGYLLVDTVCSVSETGEAQRFVFLR